MKPRLLYIDQLVGPTSLDIINALTRHYQVVLYSGFIIETYAKLSPEVKWIKRPRYSKVSMRARIVSWLKFYFRTLPSVLFAPKKEVFLVSNPPLNFFVGYCFAKVFRTRFTLLLFDIYPDIIVQSGYVGHRHPIARVWAALNKRAFPKAHRIFTLSENLAKEVAKYEPTIDNIRIIPNWVDNEKIKPIPKHDNAFIQKHGWGDKFIVMYSGNMGKTHDLETIVEAAKLLKDRSEIQFVFIGDGEKKPMLEKMVADYSLSNVTLLPFQPADMFKYSIACADIGFVTLADGFENYSVPSKTYYLLAAGCILFAIASKGSEMEWLINRYQCGRRFDSGTAPAVAKGILELIDYVSLRQETSRHSREASSHFTMKNAIQIADETAAR